MHFTDERRYFVSEATVYRLLKAHDLISSPAYVVVKAVNEFPTKTTRPNEMWQTSLSGKGNTCHDRILAVEFALTEYLPGQRGVTRPRRAMHATALWILETVIMLHVLARTVSYLPSPQ